MVAKVQTSNRKECVACFDTLKHAQRLHTFKDFPVYMGISTNSDASEDLRADMKWVCCKSCGTVQLAELIDPEVLYQRPHNPSIGSTWRKHHEAFAQYVLAHGGRRILEIGGANKVLQGYVLKEASVEAYTVCDVHGYDIEVDDPRAKQIRTYLTADTSLQVDCDTIVHSHTFEHFYNPINQLKELGELLEVGQKMVMSIPNIEKMIDDKFTNGLNFEHTFMVSAHNLEHMLNKSGFEIEDITNYSEHNFFVSCTKSATEVEHEIADDGESHVFQEFVDFYESEAAWIQLLVEKSKKKAYLFGCHIFSQYLLSFGLKEESFEALLDNDPAKIGNRLYGTGLMTLSPKTLKEVDHPLVVLKAGVYTDEIMNDIIANCNKETEFIL